MKPKIDIVTLGVEDLEKSVRFYRYMLELDDEQVVAGEDHVAFFLDSEMSLVLFPRAEIARIADQRTVAPSSAEIMLSHTAANKEEVDEILTQAECAGGTILQQGSANEWGYAGSFLDLDGHIWEVSAAIGGTE